jgi:hypothetical protein
MDDNLYDEFGNYIGPDIPELNDSLSDEDIERNEDQDHEIQNGDKPIIVTFIITFRQIITIALY